MNNDIAKSLAKQTRLLEEIIKSLRNNTIDPADALKLPPLNLEGQFKHFDASTQSLTISVSQSEKQSSNNLEVFFPLRLYTGSWLPNPDDRVNIIFKESGQEKKRNFSDLDGVEISGHGNNDYKIPNAPVVQFRIRDGWQNAIEGELSGSMLSENTLLNCPAGFVQRYKKPAEENGFYLEGSAIIHCRVILAPPNRYFVPHKLVTPEGEEFIYSGATPELTS